MNTALYLSRTNSPARASLDALRPSRRVVARADHDFYPTPPEAVRALLSVEQFDGPIWEPACGDGAIARELEAAGHDVHATDLVDRGHGVGNHDFLSPLTFTRVALEYPRLKHIVTNPPYSYKPGIGDRFVGQALRFGRMQRGKVAMLLNIGSLAHPSRTMKWRNHPPASIHIMDDLTCWPYGDRSRAGRSIAEQRYCWIVWTPDHAGPTEVTWLRMAEFRSPCVQHAGGRA